MALIMAGLPSLRASVHGLRSRKAMLETLVRRLNMVRLSAGAVALLSLAMVGCTGLIDDGSKGLTPEQAVARRMWTDKAEPALITCVSCHNGSRPNIDFLVGSGLDMRDALLAFEPTVVNIGAAQSSRLITKGAHEGPSLGAVETSDILEWIRAEKDAAGSTEEPAATLETARFRPLICTSGTPPAATCPVNDVDLTSLGLPGAKLHFVAQALGSGLYLNQLSVIAGADGVFIEHPLFVSYPADGEPKPDMIDRFFNVKMNLMANANEQLNGGTASFVNFVATDEIAIHFKALQKYQVETPGGPGGGGGGGCKVLASFKTNAAQLLTQSCLSCHGGGDGNATSALALTGVNSADDAMVQTACNQVLTRVNTITPDQSGIFLAPDPNNNNHPFRFNAAQLNTFKNGPPGAGLLKWIDDEKTAP